MSFLGAAYSQVAALGQKQGRPNLGASEVPTGDREHSWSPAVPTGGNMMGAQLAQALGQPNAFMTHRGNLQLIGQLPRESRDYSPHTGSSALRPTLPLMQPPITRAVLSVSNADDGTANLMGEQGYAVHVEQGVSRFDGPIWGGRWVKIDGVGHFTDTLAGELGAGVDPEHHYADGTVCGDSKGRDQTDIPTRIFYMQESDLPAVGDYVFELMRDQYGAAWGGGSGGTVRQGLGNITTGWAWVTGQENVVGRITFNPTNAIIDGTADTTRTYSALVPSGPDSDPNGQKDWVFGYSWGPSGSRMAITANVYDEKIDSVKPWLGGLGSIPGGWKLITTETESAGRYIIGYAKGTDYDPPGTLLGSATLQPDPHLPQATTINTTGIEINDHGAVNVTTSETGITINDHASANVTATSTEISINDHTSVSVSSSTTHITIADHAGADVSSSDVIVEAHPSHKHAGVDDGYFISTIGGASGPAGTPATDSAGDTSPVTWFYKVGFDPLTWLSDIQVTVGGLGLTLSHDVTPHHHTTPILTHEITDTSHSHTTPVLTHVVVESPHLHTTPIFTHYVNDPGHLHTTPILIHTITDPGHAHSTPTLVHSVEDNRPPGVVMVMIKRVGPDDD